MVLRPLRKSYRNVSLAARDIVFNPLTTNPPKWSNTLKQLPTNCWNVFDHFARLALKGLRRSQETMKIDDTCTDVIIVFCPDQERKDWTV